MRLILMLTLYSCCFELKISSTNVYQSKLDCMMMWVLLSTASERHWQTWREWTSCRTARRWWRWRTWIPPSSRWRSTRGMAWGRSSTTAAKTLAWSSTRHPMISSSSKKMRPVRTPTASTTSVRRGGWNLIPNQVQAQESLCCFLSPND